MTRRGDVYFNSHFKDLMFNKKSLEKEEMVHYYIEVISLSKFHLIFITLVQERQHEGWKFYEVPVVEIQKSFFCDECLYY